MAESRTFDVRVRPKSKSDHVGGTWGEDGPLNVWVSRPGVDGAANKSTIEILANALGLRKRQLTVVGGETAAIKSIRLDEPPADIDARLARWRSR